MKTRAIFGSFLIFISGICTFFTPFSFSSLPIIVKRSSEAIIYVGFFDVEVQNLKPNIQVDPAVPSVWTPLSIPSFIMFSFFVFIGIMSIIIGFITFFHYISLLEIKHYRIMPIIAVALGFLNVIIEVLIYFGNKYQWGLSNLSSGESIGLGYWVLLLSGIELILGGLLIHLRN